MGGFTFAPRRRAYGTFWQILFPAIFRLLKRIFTINVVDTQTITIDMINTETKTIEMEGT